MPAPSASFMFSPSFGLSKAITAAKMCQVTWVGSGGDPAEIQTQLGASTYSVIGQFGLAPPVIVWDCPPTGKIVSWGGIGSTRQFLAYLAMSQLVGGTGYTGKVSAFIKYCVDAQWASILAALGGAGPNSPPTPVFLCGASGGGACVVHLANRLITSYANAFDVRGVYTFGSPKPGNHAHNNAVSSVATGASIRAQGDPICCWPSRGTGIIANVFGGSLPGTLAYATWNDYQDLQFCYHVAPPGGGSFRQEPSHNPVGDEDIIELVRAALASNNLPPAHSINNYVLQLMSMGIKEAFTHRWTNVLSTVEGVCSVHATVDDTQADISAPSLPGISQFQVIPGVPGGTTQSTGRGILRTYGNATVLDSGGSATRRPRAKKHDGSTKRRVKQMHRIMQQVRSHDDGVFYGFRKTSRVFLTPAKLSSEEFVAWDTIYEALQRVTSEWA